MNRAIALNPRASSYYYVLAGLYRRLGEMEDSRKALESFTRLDRESNELEKMRRSAAKPRSQLPPAREATIEHAALGRAALASLVFADAGPGRGGIDSCGSAPRACGHAGRFSSCRFHRRHAGSRPAAGHEHLRQRHEQTVPARRDGLRRRALFDYDNDGWLDIFLVNGSSLDPAVRDRRPDELSVSQQSRRNVHRRHAEGRPDSFRLGAGLLRGRLRQRRLRRSVRQLLGTERPVPQQRRRHVHRRIRKGRRRRVRRPMGSRLLLPRL